LLYVISILGLFIAHECVRLNKEDPGECFKKKSQLYIDAIMCYKTDINRIARHYLDISIKQSEQFYGKQDRTLKFIDVKLSCEVNNKPIILNYK